MAVRRIFVQAYDSRLQEADGSYTCLPSHRLPPPPRQQTSSSFDAAAVPSKAKGGGDRGGGGGGWPEGGCESISTVRGYAIVSQGPLLSVYNTTDETSRLVFTRRTTMAMAVAMGQEEGTGLCGEGVISAAASEGGEEGGVARGAAGASAGGSRWSVMSSASGEVLVAEASRCTAVSYNICILSDSYGPGWSRGAFRLVVDGWRANAMFNGRRCPWRGTGPVSIAVPFVFALGIEHPELERAVACQVSWGRDFWPWEVCPPKRKVRCFFVSNIFL